MRQSCFLFVFLFLPVSYICWKFKNQNLKQEHFVNQVVNFYMHVWSMSFSKLVQQPNLFSHLCTQFMQISHSWDFVHPADSQDCCGATDGLPSRTALTHGILHGSLDVLCVYVSYDETKWNKIVSENMKRSICCLKNCQS